MDRIQMKNPVVEMDDLKADVGTDGSDIEVEIGSFEDIVNATEDEGKGE